ncbi:MAG: histidine phosphatase family protein, partial [Desulfobacula sp.]|nr:histidine phosphatase family protein [Desulfobacula sp.]
MKNIILVRHAKSSWKNLSLDDFARPLNKRGKRDAPFMGKQLKNRKIMPDIILSSPAKRAKKTVKTIAKVIGYPKKKIIFDNNMYHADALYLFQMVTKLNDKNDTIMCIGH